MTLDSQQICLQVVERLRDHATRQGNVPFLTGDLRKSHVTQPDGDGAILTVGMPYARAVHDGRRAVTIKPKRKKALYWSGADNPVKSVKLPATEGNPWLTRAIADLQAEGLGWLAPQVGDAVADDLTAALRAQGVTVQRREP